MAQSPLETVSEQTCEQHGTYLATRFGRSPWTKCPFCKAESEAWAKRKREEDRKEREADELAARIAARMRLSGICGRFKNATFDTFKTLTPAHSEALDICQTFADTVKHDSGGGGLWLIGPPGTGKTHLATAIASHLILERRMSACVYGVHEVMRMLRARFGVKDPDPYSRDLQTTEQVIEYLSSVSLLVLDEVGVSRGGDWEAEQLFTIVDERYRMERPTIVVSNLPTDRLKPVLGDRVHDRLREGSRAVYMNWPSHRGLAKES